MIMVSFRSIAAAFFGVFCATTAALANSSTFSVGTTQITVEPEKAYCALDRAQVFDAAWLDIQVKSNTNMNEVLGGFMLCDELTRLRAGEQLNLSRWIILMAPTMGKAKASPLTGITRAQFLSLIEGEFQKGVELDVDDVVGKVNDARAEVTSDDALDPITIKADNMPFLLGKTDNGVFAGLTMQVGDASGNMKVGAVLAMSLVNQHMISVNVYRDFNTPETINLLLAEATGMINRIIKAN